jgi:CRISPR-associated protein Cmr4
MKGALIGLLAETSLHPGSEATGGVIDLPVAREGPTGYPVITGSSLKGALRDKAELLWEAAQVETVFGKPDEAGGVAVTDARLLLLPVRSLTSHYRWVTSPFLLERFQRDCALVGLKTDFNVPNLKSEEALDGQGGKLFLEELSFTVAKDEGLIRKLADTIGPLCLHQSVRERLKDQLVLISDDDMKHFALTGLQVNARNELDKRTKTSKNLWYEETIPADSLFYSLIIASPRRDGCELAFLQAVFTESPYLQVGGNETIGQGWCAVSWLEGGKER